MDGFRIVIIPLRKSKFSVIISWINATNLLERKTEHQDNARPWKPETHAYIHLYRQTDTYTHVHTYMRICHMLRRNQTVWTQSKIHFIARKLLLT